MSETPAGSPDPGDHGQIELRIDPTKALWGLVLVLGCLLLLLAIVVMRQGDRIEALEATVATLQQGPRGRGQAQTQAGKGGWSQAVVAGQERGGTQDTPRRGTGAKGEARTIPDEEYFAARKAGIEERLEAYITEQGLEAEQAEAMRTIVQESYANIQAIRQQARDGELPPGERQPVIQAELERRHALVVEQLGQEQADAFQLAVYQQELGAGLARTPGGQAPR